MLTTLRQRWGHLAWADDLPLPVAMPAHYHRGKVHLLLRSAGLVPVSVDYIAFVRGVPAVVTPPAR